MQLVKTARKNKLQALVLAVLTAGAVFTAVAGVDHAEAQPRPRPAAVADGVIEAGVVVSGDGVTVKLGTGGVDPWS
ncbi:hypothetical protein [Streptomyces diastatochromogenes]|uniref:Uncharacterized protein n=1 Tax=Streptomyces diastatochromogenes TaxID=42236 RepID=A0A233SRF9_STRDA|nr:hypothetical protein [Streptomyces diastatochromogenes]MCZ0987169.1 hypothetical protein [Streptomyces diastatochromogenes]OXY98233.1 hypothetical protein BEK98_05025 [Streptomyces diastatochromogenes]